MTLGPPLAGPLERATRGEDRFLRVLSLPQPQEDWLLQRRRRRPRPCFRNQAPSPRKPHLPWPEVRKKRPQRLPKKKDDGDDCNRPGKRRNDAGDEIEPTHCARARRLSFLGGLRAPSVTARAGDVNVCIDPFVRAPIRAEARDSFWHSTPPGDVLPPSGRRDAVNRRQKALTAVRERRDSNPRPPA